MRRFWHSAWILLILANLFWAANIVLGRGVVGMVPPIALAFWRWFGAFLVAVPFAWPYLKRDLPTLLGHWPLMLILSATGIASYNTMSYIGLTSTTALNVLLLQSAGPLIIIVWAFLLFRERPSPLQVLAVMLSLCGVAVIAAHGSLEALLHLSLNAGDVWILAAMVIYGIYAAMFRVRPAAHPMSFLVATMGIGSMMILPFYLWEYAEGGRVQGSVEALLAMAYIAVFPSFVAYLFFNRGIELIGAARAGQSWHLMPVFGSILAVLFLGEHFYAYHAAGIILIAGGIVLASVKSERRTAAAEPPERLTSVS
ncbi:MAG TPA: DMT family transporter [Acetobacteraceae bacterium]|jgi:drug/metabolite transporter (DMT)-like permease|nr:DMT family transporter [Acetobacteraceae bacterium]